MLSDNGSGFRGELGSILDRKRVEQGYTSRGLKELNGVLERAIAMLSANQQAAREETHLLFPDAEIPKRLESLWDEGMVWSVDAFSHPYTSSCLEHKSPHGMYFGKQAPFRLLPYLAPILQEEAYEQRSVQCWSAFLSWTREKLSLWCWSYSD